MDNIFFHKTDQLLHCLIPWCVPSLRLTYLLCMPNCENCVSRRKSWIWPAQETCKAVILKLNETFSQGSGGSMVCVDNQTNQCQHKGSCPIQVLHPLSLLHWTHVSCPSSSPPPYPLSSSSYPNPAADFSVRSYPPPSRAKPSPAAALPLTSKSGLASVPYKM